MGQGACILGCSGPRLTPQEARCFAEGRPFGFILFARNIETPEQLRRLCGDLRQAVGSRVPILIDQEGGRVARLRAPHWHEWMPPYEQVRASGGNARRSMRLRYRLIGHELRDVGIDCNCAPVADIARNATHEILANRCYGSDPGLVADISRSVAQGLVDAGIMPVLKHMPGHGRAVLDSHLELPIVTASQTDLRATDFAPFKALNDLPMAMTAHIVYSEIDELPATFSPKVIDMIRAEIGFQGLLMSDDISMQALSGSVAERSRLALGAGCDVVLHCNGDPGEMQAVAAACGELNRAGSERGARALASRGTGSEIDIEATRAELAELIRGGVIV